MEILGIITLRVSDDKYGRIRLQINNNDKKGVQLQVFVHFGVSLWQMSCILPLKHLFFSPDPS